MKDISFNTLRFFVIISLLFTFIGCGGGGGSEENSEPTASEPVSYTSIIVERGKVYDSTVTDSSGAVASKSIGSNSYAFTTTLVYPIKANGGWIDVDDDGKLTSSDILLGFEMSSYSDFITPITTFISDEDSATRTSRLEMLSTITNTSIESLLKVPSQSNKETILLTNAIFKTMLEYGTENVFNYYDDINQNYIDLTEYLNSTNHKNSLSEISKILEEKVVSESSNTISPSIENISDNEALLKSLQCPSTEFNTDENNRTYIELSDENDPEFIELVCTYYASGSLELQGLSVNSMVHGLLTRYSETGVVKSEDSFLYDKRDGLSKEYRDDGNIWFQTAYKKGLKHGLELWYDQNGSIETSTVFVNDSAQEGIYYTYYPSGAVNVVTETYNDIPHGLELVYYENGVIALEKNRVDGLVQGIQTGYGSNGHISDTITIVDDVAHGPWKAYCNSGLLSDSGLYENGIRVSAISHIDDDDPCSPPPVD